MVFRRQTFSRVSTAILLCVSAPAAFPANLPITGSWAQRKITSGKFPIHSACMMPPHTDLGTMKGAEGVTKESEVWAAALEKTVEFHLKSDGIAIGSASNPLLSGASDGEIRGVISQVQQKFTAALPWIRKKPGGILKSAYTLGDEVGSLPCSENSDILVFVHGVDKIVTEGHTAMRLLASGPIVDAVLLVTLADAKTGEILGFIQVYPGDASMSDPESAFGQKLDQMLADMNIGTARKRAAASGH